MRRSQWLIQKILEYVVVYFISRHCFSYFVFDWYWVDKKSPNSSSLIIKEKYDKKGGCFNWLFQTFKTREVVVTFCNQISMCLSLWITEPLFTCYCQKLKLAYAVYFALASDIKFHTSTHDIYIWFLLL